MYISLILMATIIGSIGVFVKNPKHANLIAGYNSDKNGSDTEKITGIVSNGLIYIAGSNTLIVVMFMVIEKFTKYDSVDDFVIIPIIVNVLASVITIIYMLNKKEKVR